MQCICNHLGFQLLGHPTQQLKNLRAICSGISSPIKRIKPWNAMASKFTRGSSVNFRFVGWTQGDFSQQQTHQTSQQTHPSTKLRFTVPNVFANTLHRRRVNDGSNLTWSLSSLVVSGHRWRIVSTPSKKEQQNHTHNGIHFELLVSTHLHVRYSNWLIPRKVKIEMFWNHCLDWVVSTSVSSWWRQECFETTVLAASPLIKPLPSSLQWSSFGHEFFQECLSP